MVVVGENEPRSSEELIKQARDRIRAFDEPRPDGELPDVDPPSVEVPVYDEPPAPQEPVSVASRVVAEQPVVEEPPTEDLASGPEPTAMSGSPMFRRPFWTRLVGRLVIGLLVFGGWWLFTSFDDAERDDAGEIVGGGDLDVTTLDRGDCFDDPEGDVVFDVQAVPCSELHDNEVFAVGSLASTFGENFPGLETLDAYTYETCIGSPFESYVGTTYETSSLGVFTFIPTEESWDDGDRGYICALYDIDLTPLSGSVRDSGI